MHVHSRSYPIFATDSTASASTSPRRNIDATNAFFVFPDGEEVDSVSDYLSLP